MKLQNLIIIFIIIIIPLIVVFSYYLQLETKTINIQTDYDEKLIEATKEAVEAFEINTTEWNSEYASLANSKRRDLMSSINVFTEGMASKLGVSGSAKENILQYIPAIVFTMYDGYYIYTPTYVPENLTNKDGIQLFYYEKETDEKFKITTNPTQVVDGETEAGEPIYKGTSKSGKFYYTENREEKYKEIQYTTDINSAEKTYKHILKTFVPYTTKYGDYVINYTLDNYIRIYGKEESKEGYIIDDINSIEIDSNGILLNMVDEYIKPETLTENILEKENDNFTVNKYKYIYNSNNEKRYYDKSKDKFFILNNNEKMYLADVNNIESGLVEFKKRLVLKEEEQYIELLQPINVQELRGKWYILTNEGYREYTDESLLNTDITSDFSAMNYYIENYCFNNWLNNNFTSSQITEILKNKNEKIIENIQKNLLLSLANYTANSNIDYKLPKLTDDDWEQALSNVSMITFFQGIKTGIKTYNNYAIVTSTENNEYVNENSLYYLTNIDEYYHKYGCNQIKDEGELVVEEAYKNIEFKPQNYDNGIYYKHTNSENESKQQCFYCIVNLNNLNSDEDLYQKTYFTALARERYIQMGRNRLSEIENAEVCTHESCSYNSNDDEATHKKTCNDCGTEINENCTPSDSWEKDSSDHWKVCTVCEQKLEKSKHNYKLGKCKECNHKKNILLQDR